MTSKKLDWQDDFYDRFREFLDNSNYESDRGKALVAAAVVEQMLDEILKNYLANKKETNDLFDGASAPLHSFFGKLRLAYALNLISPHEHATIDCIRKVRNEFAHKINCSFSDDRIRDLSSSLNLGLEEIDALPEGHKSRVDNPRDRFHMVSTSIVSSLYNRAHYVGQLELRRCDFSK